jgi:hypothetical protein
MASAAITDAPRTERLVRTGTAKPPAVRLPLPPSTTSQAPQAAEHAAQDREQHRFPDDEQHDAAPREPEGPQQADLGHALADGHARRVGEADEKHHADDEDDQPA